MCYGSGCQYEKMSGSRIGECSRGQNECPDNLDEPEQRCQDCGTELEYEDELFCSECKEE